MRVCLTEPGRELLASFLGAHVWGVVEEISILTPTEQMELARLCRRLGRREP